MTWIFSVYYIYDFTNKRQSIVCFLTECVNSSTVFEVCIKRKVQEEILTRNAT